MVAVPPIFAQTLRDDGVQAHISVQSPDEDQVKEDEDRGRYCLNIALPVFVGFTKIIIVSLPSDSTYTLYTSYPVTYYQPTRGGNRLRCAPSVQHLFYHIIPTAR